MAGLPRALIIHRVPEIRSSLRFHLGQQGIEVAAEAGEGRQAMTLFRRLRPGLLVIDAHLGDADGIALAETFHRAQPLAGIIILGKTLDAALLQRAIRAGAREFLVEPVDLTELLGALERLRPLLEAAPSQESTRRGTLAVVVSNKGGVGKTTVSTNLAVGLRRVSGEKVALVDLDLDFGDVATVLDLAPTRTIADLIPHARQLDGTLLESLLIEHPSGLKVLPAPRRGQEAEGIGGDLVGPVLEILGERYPYVVVDTGTSLDEAVLAALDLADQVLLVTTLDVVSLKNVAQMMDLLERLAYPLQRVKLLANRWNGKSNIVRADAEKSLGLPINFLVPSDYRRVIDSINRGVPFVSAAPEAPISRSVLEVCRAIVLNGRRG